MRAGDALRRHRLWVDRLMVVLMSLLFVLPVVALLMFDAWMREPGQPPLFGVPPVLVIIAGPVLWLVLTLLLWLASARFPRTFRYAAGMLLAVNFLYIPIYALIPGRPLSALAVAAILVGTATAFSAMFRRGSDREEERLNEPTRQPESEQQQGQRQQMAEIAAVAVSSSANTSGVGWWLLDIVLSALLALVMAAFSVHVLGEMGALGSCFEGSCGYVGVFVVLPLLWPILVVVILFLLRRYPRQGRPAGWGALLVVPALFGALAAVLDSAVAAGALLVVVLTACLVIFVVYRQRNMS